MAPLIIDTDPGVDDAFAIVLAANSDEVDLRAVTTVFGNVPLSATTTNALRLLALCGREDVPVAAGASRPLVHAQPHRAAYAHGEDGLSGQSASLPERERGVQDCPAVELMAEVLSAADEPVTIAPIGPLTNVALLLATYPGLKPKIGRLVVMGGALGVGNVSPVAEFNVWSDPEAARRVLVEEDVPVTMVPLDLTVACAVDASWLRRLAAGGPVGAALHRLTPSYHEFYAWSLGIDGLVLHDAVALAEAVRPGILHTTAYSVDVDCSLGPARGQVIADRRRRREDTEQPRTIDIALDADRAGLHEFLLERLHHAHHGR